MSDRRERIGLPEITAAVEEAARIHLSDHGRLLAVTPLHTTGRPYSSTHRLELQFERDTLDVCLKLHQHRDPALAEQCVAWAEEEFNVLKTIAAASRDSRELSVVKPLAFLPRLPGILLETHHGTVLNSVLRSRRFGLKRRSIEDLERSYEKLGISLRELHGLTSQNRGVVDALQALSPITYSLSELLAEADGGFQGALSLVGGNGHASAERAYQLSRESFRRAMEVEYRRFGVHGDFTPMNVFVLGPKVTLFDFVNFHLGHPYEDVTRFISYTYFVQKDPLCLRRRDVSRLVAAFMRGYGLADGGADPVLLFFFQKSMYRTLAGGLRADKSWPLGAIYRRAMLRVFEQWMDEGMGLPA